VPDSTSLHGLTVVELSSDLAGDLCGGLLATLGATVIKLDPGRTTPSHYLGRSEAERARSAGLVNERKQMKALADLDGGTAQRLLDTADVVLVGWEPDHDKPPAGFAHLDLSAARWSGRTVACHLSAFGSEGPLAGTPGSDLTLQAASGVMATTGEADGQPLRAGADLGAAIGALYGVIGICAALIERNRSECGQVVEVAVYDCLVSTLTNFASRILGGSPPLRRLGNQGPNTAPWNLFPTRDGHSVYIIAGSNPTFDRLAAAMGRAELATDSRFDTGEHRRAHKDLITRLVAEWAAEHDAADIVTTLRDNGVPVSLVATTSEVLSDPHFDYRELLWAEGDRQALGSPLGRWTFATTQSADLAASARPRNAAARLAGAEQLNGAKRPRPLDGVRVVDLGTLTAGPFCCRLLANLGADVVKIEPPSGEVGRHSPPMMGDESVYFHMTNNDKRSVSAELATAEGHARVERLIQDADIVIENQSPGALTKRGLGALDMLAVNPGLLYVSVTGYGHTGPLGGLRAYDTVIQAGAGLMSLTGNVGGLPVKTGISSADVIGALCATAGVLAGMYGRQVGNHPGAWIDAALFDGIAWTTHAHWPSVLLGQPPHARYGNGHWCEAPQGVYTTADGPVAVSVESDAQWAGLCDVLQRFDAAVTPELRAMDGGQRWAARAHLDELLAAACAERETTAVVAACNEHGVPVSPVLEVSEVLESAQLKARGLIADLDLPNGAVMRVINVPVRLRRTPGYVSHPAPALASSNEEVFA
jgi:crotonobetainyl-CoA:carnitine CoA-transferase CaiB-like acyl-CoA transferase